MKVQNKANHTRMEGKITVALLILFGWTIVAGWALIQLIETYSLREDVPKVISPRFMLLPFSVIIFAWMIAICVRKYSTKLQDRIIKQEENFRHYVMTGKTLNPALTMSQIVALRFAGDNEYLELSEKAIAENLTNKQIKSLITNRRADHHRV